MKKFGITALLVMLFFPSLLFAESPSVQSLDILIDALVVCPPNSPMRFVDNGDGTICDHQTGLMWEKKNASDLTADLDNPHDVDNIYFWTSEADGDYTNPDGTAFTDFLSRLNGVTTNTVSSNQLGGHSDWRLPTIAELQTILDCSFSSCIDPIFGPAVGFYWSSTSSASGPVFAWGAYFTGSGVSTNGKPVAFRVRAVRGGR